MQDNAQPELDAPVPQQTLVRHARVLVVDDETDACEACRRMLTSHGCVTTGATSAQAALAQISEQQFDVVVADVVMAEMSGLELCRRLAELGSTLPVILMTGRGDMDLVIEALRAGAVDFLKKPIDRRALCAAVARALPPAPAPRRSPPRGGRATDGSGVGAEPRGIVGRSPGIRRVQGLVSDLSASLASVLLQGESGTGKEVVARAIHSSSRVHAGPFVALNCAAMPAGLLESSLFGHTRGAFTDAKRASKGLFLEANGGTLLLDEIGELPLEMQPKLLRALQERTVRPVGGRDEVPFDCRLITATNRDLEHEVKSRRFREDLYYRLDVVRITVPPLRERGSDILELARHFVARFAKSAQKSLTLSDAFAATLLAYTWPGNVRELENCVERAVAMARADELTVEDLPSKIRLFEPARPPPRLDAEVFELPSLGELERRHILRAIEISGGNKTLAAQALGINRRTLQRRLKVLLLADAERAPAKTTH